MTKNKGFEGTYDSVKKSFAFIDYSKDVQKAT